MYAVTQFLQSEIDFTLRDNPSGSVHSFVTIEDYRASPGPTLCDPR
jgi:hypothetical protein